MQTSAQSHTWIRASVVGDDVYLRPYGAVYERVEVLALGRVGIERGHAHRGLPLCCWQVRSPRGPLLASESRACASRPSPQSLASQSAPQASAAYLCACRGLCGCRTFEAAAGCLRSSARRQARSGGPARRVGRSTRRVRKQCRWRCLPGSAGSLLRRCIPRAPHQRLPALRRALCRVPAARRQCLFIDKDT